MVAGAKVCGAPDGMRSTVIHLPSHLSVAAVLKEKCKIDLCVMRITGSKSKDQRSLKKIVQTFMKDDGGEQYLRLPTTVVVVVTAKTYHKMFFFCRQQTDS
ncbi:hypothetical protein DY000_02060309 [Brassica cretica]|uniref:Uncharacterized protein n=1 Tax=Brassica cretica TaxID=69181 RepID=A0ABQ7AYB5_BRACR|nr:hypothetical protein DY000_02060309 [Brassica cretica]